MFIYGKAIWDFIKNSMIVKETQAVLYYSMSHISSKGP